MDERVTLLNESRDNKNYSIKVIDDLDSKSKATDLILRQLPEWFGIEESILEYVDKATAFDGKSFRGKWVYRKTFGEITNIQSGDNSFLWFRSIGEFK
jgi:hypothetical protein